MTILDAMRDPALFGPWFSAPSWSAWRAFLAALFALPLEGAALDLYCRHTQRTAPPTVAPTEAWVIAGRRAGKSRLAALVAVYLACFRDYRAALAVGEVGTLAVIAADRRQARTIFRYVSGFIDAVPMLSKLVEARTAETITLSNRVVIEVHTASWRTLRGYTLVGAIADEIAFWRTEDSASPDTEILAALRPAMATIPGALLLAISSPYARRGALFGAWRKHYGQGHDGDPVLVWQAATQAMNPNVDPQVIADAYADDEAAARSEYGNAEGIFFRSDIESFISREAVDACVIPGRRELPPLPGTEYRAFVDPSGGSADAMTLAIAHAQSDGTVVLDLVRERRPPFSPASVVEEFTELCQRYGVTTVVGDRYGGEFCREPFRARGVAYELSEKPRSDLYRDLLPRLNSGEVELLDHPRLAAQLCALERRTARGGRDSIDHPPGGHDDLANAVAGALIGAQQPKRGLSFAAVGAGAPRRGIANPYHPGWEPPRPRPRQRLWRM